MLGAGHTSVLRPIAHLSVELTGAFPGACLVVRRPAGPVLAFVALRRGTGRAPGWTTSSPPTPGPNIFIPSSRLSKTCRVKYSRPFSCYTTLSLSSNLYSQAGTTAVHPHSPLTCELHLQHAWLRLLKSQPQHCPSCSRSASP